MSHYRHAYEATLAASQALDSDALIAVNIDVPTAITTSLGRLPQIMTFREQVSKVLIDFDLTNFDKLETYTQATGHARALYSAASASPEALTALNEKGIVLRDTLYSDAVALANRGLISGDKISTFKANVGYKNLAFDLLGLAALLRGSLDAIASKTAIQASELDAAELIGEQIVNAVAVREQAPVVAATQAQQRQRNFTLFANAYDQVRRAISYLRWNQDDVDQIAPSLYAGRGTGRKKPDAKPAPPLAPTPVLAPAPAASAAKPVSGLPNGNPFAAN